MIPKSQLRGSVLWICNRSQLHSTTLRQEALTGFQIVFPTGRRHQAVRLFQSAAALRNGVLDGCRSNLWPQSILPSIFVFQTRLSADLPSYWQLDGLYTPSLIIPLDLGILYVAPSWCAPAASWAHLGRNYGLPRKKTSKIFFET